MHSLLATQNLVKNKKKYISVWRDGIKFINFTEARICSKPIKIILNKAKPDCENRWQICVLIDIDFYLLNNKCYYLIILNVCESIDTNFLN